MDARDATDLEPRSSNHVVPVVEHALLAAAAHHDQAHGGSHVMGWVLEDVLSDEDLAVVGHCRGQDAEHIAGGCVVVVVQTSADEVDECSLQTLGQCRVSIGNSVQSCFTLHGLLLVEIDGRFGDPLQLVVILGRLHSVGLVLQDKAIQGQAGIFCVDGFDGLADATADIDKQRPRC
jgi:hypothetical protein